MYTKTFACPTLALAAAIALCVPVATNAATDNPYAPAYGHAYRGGAFPTLDTWRQMRAWESGNAAATSKTVTYGGGINEVGVVSGPPKVYLVARGSQWGDADTDSDGNLVLANDPVGAIAYLQRLFKGIGTLGERWSAILTQYCDGPLVSLGAASCPAAAAHIAYPLGGAFAGIWYDDAAPAPDQPSGHDLALEAVAAAAHFGNTTASSNRYAIYIVVSPTGTHPDGFNTPRGGFCGWHDWNGDRRLNGGGAAPSPYGNIAFINLPYVYDDPACPTNSVNPGEAGKLDAFSIIAGHEYAETMTNMLAPTGWWNHGTSFEVADECYWITEGQGAMANVTLATGSFAMQGLWSNSTNQCEIGSGPFEAEGPWKSPVSGFAWPGRATQGNDPADGAERRTEQRVTNDRALVPSDQRADRGADDREDDRPDPQ